MGWGGVEWNNHTPAGGGGGGGPGVEEACQSGGELTVTEMKLESKQELACVGPCAL